MSVSGVKRPRPARFNTENNTALNAPTAKRPAARNLAGNFDNAAVTPTRAYRANLYTPSAQEEIPMPQNNMLNDPPVTASHWDNTETVDNEDGGNGDISLPSHAAPESERANNVLAPPAVTTTPLRPIAAVTTTPLRPALPNTSPSNDDVTEANVSVSHSGPATGNVLAATEYMKAYIGAVKTDPSERTAMYRAAQAQRVWLAINSLSATIKTFAGAEDLMTAILRRLEAAGAGTLEVAEAERIVADLHRVYLYEMQAKEERERAEAAEANNSKWNIVSVGGRRQRRKTRNNRGKQGRRKSRRN